MSMNIVVILIRRPSRSRFLFLCCPKCPRIIIQSQGRQASSCPETSVPYPEIVEWQILTFRNHEDRTNLKWSRKLTWQLKALKWGSKGPSRAWLIHRWSSARRPNKNLNCISTPVWSTCAGLKCPTRQQWNTSCCLANLPSFILKRKLQSIRRSLLTVSRWPSYPSRGQNLL